MWYMTSIRYNPDAAERTANDTVLPFITKWKKAVVKCIANEKCLREEKCFSVAELKKYVSWQISQRFETLYYKSARILG